MHDNPYVVSKSDGTGVGYVDSYQPFHDNIYSTSAQVTPSPVLNRVIIIFGLGLGTLLLHNQPRIRRHIR